MTNHNRFFEWVWILVIAMCLKTADRMEQIEKRVAALEASAK